MWSSVNDALPNNFVHIYSMSALSSTNVWAVGEYEQTTPGTIAFFAEHWNGHVWTQVTVPEPTDTGLISSRLTSIVTFSSYDIDAFGDYSTTQTQQYNTPIAEHWNGISWSISN
jgi:hypothetical protein